MNPILKNVLAMLGGLVVGAVINSGLVNLGPSIIPLPEGADISNMDRMKETFHLFEARNFIFPYLGHAIGTLAGAYTAARFAATHQMKLALGVGFFFLLGGITMVNLLPSPTWFNILDLVTAYIPMGWLGGKMAGGNRLAIV